MTTDNPCDEANQSVHARRKTPLERLHLHRFLRKGRRRDPCNLISEARIIDGKQFHRVDEDTP